MIADAYFNAFHIHDPAGNVALSRFEGLGTPPPRDDRPDRARRHGAIELTTYYHPRVWDIEGYVKGTSPSDAWDVFDNLKEQLALSGLTHYLKFKRLGRSFFERANVSAASEVTPTLRMVGNVIPWGVTLVSADPRIYVDTPQTLSFASAGTATNTGNFSTPPTITFHGGGTNPGIHNAALSAENDIVCDYVMVGGDEIVVDVGTRNVTLNGVSRPDIIDMAQTDFWSLTKGANALSKLGGAVSIDVDWRSARI